MLREEIARLAAQRNEITAQIAVLKRQLARVEFLTQFTTASSTPAGEFAGLSDWAVRQLYQAGLRSRTELEELYRSEGKPGLLRLRKIGPKTANEVAKWIRKRISTESPL